MKETILSTILMVAIMPLCISVMVYNTLKDMNRWWKEEGNKKKREHFKNRRDR